MPKSEVFCMDCMELMAKYPDGYFDFAIVDPPYGIGQPGVGNASRSRLAQAQDYKPFYGGDTSAPPAEYFSELRRVSKNQIIWGANHFISRLPIDSSCWIVWDKDNGDTDFADCELAWTSYPSAVRKFKYRWQGMLQEHMGVHKEIRIHPTQKPVELYAWLLAKYAKPGYKILDTHLGSGSSRIAAWDAGLDFVGSEIDEYYFAKMDARFQEHAAQLSLFI